MIPKAEPGVLIDKQSYKISFSAGEHHLHLDRSLPGWNFQLPFRGKIIIPKARNSAGKVNI